ncbi:hypothetical protein ABMA28_009661 [Loxostege sticticalis]|uniref:Uncharacterized protein n=1 Tax=Loxostege sticticalis TaxID=481309 RepID=A0ABD0SBK6_LOXSC
MTHPLYSFVLRECYVIRVFLLLLVFDQTTCFWEVGTTTHSYARTDDTPRQSFFSKFTQQTPPFSDFLPLGVATLMNRRTLITSANYLEPYMTRQKDVRIWCLGRTGEHTTPYRYRVWRIRRLLPKSINPEHWHGPRGVHVPRHDITVIHSFDQIYVYHKKSVRYHYPYKAMLTKKHDELEDELWFAGSGFEYMEHIAENYKIFFANQTKDEIVDCSRYLPKWWGKFICIQNTHGYPGVPNGGGLFSKGPKEDYLVGVGCFEIRYNNERIMAFTDLRYYVDWLHVYANISRGEYYEYAYPQWSVDIGWIYDGHGNTPYIPRWQIYRDIFPLGKK